MMSMSGPLTLAGMVVVSVVLLAPGLGDSDPAVETSASVGRTAPTTAPNGGIGPSAASAGNGHSSHALKRGADGHFYAEAQVNGARIRFLIDTGASFVALTPNDARRAGISGGGERVKAIGAGGELDVTPVVIDRIALGPLAASKVRGAVVNELPVSLLGQSYLSQVGSVRIEGDRMILR
jgi:aspartyl protease family protein